MECCARPSINTTSKVHNTVMRRIMTFRSAMDRIYDGGPIRLYRGADKSLAPPGRKQTNISVRIA